MKSPLWRAEIANLMQMVEAFAAEAAAAEAELAERAAALSRRASANASKGAARVKGATRAAVLDFMRRQEKPVTYYRVVKHTTMSKQTAERRLRELAEEGLVRIVRTPAGRTEYLLEKAAC